jgi:hypothetical protein
MLHAISPAPERILAFGPAGSGKTTNLLNIARFSVRTHSPARFYVGDSDFAMDRMISGYPEIPFAIHNDPQYPVTPETRLVIYPLYSWPDYERFGADVKLHAKPGDWVSIDFISTAWSEVQDNFAMQVFHRDLADYFLSVRKTLDKDSKSLGALEGWVDWQVINAMYKKWANQLLYRGRYHLYATAKSDNLSSDRNPTEDRQTRALFARYQVKPVGQKDLPYQFHTLLLTGQMSDTRTLTTVKDRERTEVSGLEVKNFTTDYLVNVAGWSL